VAIRENKGAVPEGGIERKILFIRGKKVMLDRDLAALYGLETKSLNLAVKRNADRFPEDFMFELTKSENGSLRFQFETSKRGGSRYLPHVFTEYGVLMLSSVLNSERAVQVNIAIIRVFVKLKKIMTSHRQLENKLAELERKIEGHDSEICSIFEAIHQIMEPHEKANKRRIGSLE
jgi:hypothetical protein